VIAISQLFENIDSHRKVFQAHLGNGFIDVWDKPGLGISL
jgi:hypothetical protein